ncbi:adenosylcobinamide-GDP ribazoletransferase [Actinokineospora bangkokensis]|uniref:Adenosylcobinamide-GDP ribazoletransferase n=1 Tax=Actinokineospora bangkokensis TaxID=1193682 RepID=A0A1Q9LTA1_9PSEU|nr:adenosylcobinamide-GDP ribazoletransferase [Actinokineospora bangkokensis]OLR95258.1 adenosylcobinamide-GDP ribazoletransferase [Actinokineospora bangkokensis]
MRLAFSWLTVLPLHVASVDGRAAGRAISWAPVVGVVLGFAAAGTLLLPLPPLLAGVLAFAVLAVLTRGMHLDGVADTADGLGCYGPPERALEVMKRGDVGPFGVVALLVVAGVQVTAFAAVPWQAAVVAVAAGRAAFAGCCARGVRAARPEGLGALVAQTQPWWVPTVWGVLIAAGGWWSVGVRVAIGVAVAAVLVAALVWHTRRRFGGITGDVLGAACEIATCTVLIACCWG